MSPPVDTDCGKCGEFPGTEVSYNNGYTVCDACFIDENVSYTNNIIYRLRQAISEGLSDINRTLLPTLNCLQEEEAECSIREFINNPTTNLECMGSSGGGRMAYYIYRHDDGVLYTFWSIWYANDTNSITGLAVYYPPMEIDEDDPMDTRKLISLLHRQPMYIAERIGALSPYPGGNNIELQGEGHDSIYGKDIQPMSREPSFDDAMDAVMMVPK